MVAISSDYDEANVSPPTHPHTHTQAHTCISKYIYIQAHKTVLCLNYFNESQAQMLQMFIAIKTISIKYNQFTSHLIKTIEF